MSDVLKSFSTLSTPQTQRADSKQVKNSAGGYVFELDDVMRLRRFLILGSESTYYASGTKLTKENAEVVIRMAENNSKTLVDTIVDVSVRGAAPKPNQALFALAIAASFGADADKMYAFSKLNLVARTGTHLMTFITYVEQFRGWGRGLRRAVGGWYTDKDADALAYQVAKYGNREGWSHRDVLRKSHASTLDPATNAVLRWATRGEINEHTPRLIEGYLKVREPGADLAALVREYKLSWEMLPTERVNDAAVWNALLDNGMSTTALIRQLPRLTNLGLFDGKGARTKDVLAQITDHDVLRKSRVHPLQLLNAERTYSAGHSQRGNGTWTPKPQIVDGLSDAFLVSFENVENYDSHTCHALDVSGSMGWDQIGGMSITPREASAALALVGVSTSPDDEIIGFTGGGWYRQNSEPVTELNISPRQRLSDALRVVDDLPMGTTDCAQPMLWALKEGKEFDGFVVYTDNETYAGRIHPHQALREYNKKMGLNAKLVVVGMTSTGFSIADPSDPLMLDVVGLDTATPKLISEFIGGQI